MRCLRMVVVLKYKMHQLTTNHKATSSNLNNPHKFNNHQPGQANPIKLQSKCLTNQVATSNSTFLVGKISDKANLTTNKSKNIKDKKSQPKLEEINKVHHLGANPHPDSSHQPNLHKSNGQALVKMTTHHPNANNNSGQNPSSSSSGPQQDSSSRSGGISSKIAENFISQPQLNSNNSPLLESRSRTTLLPSSSNKLPYSHGRGQWTLSGKELSRDRIRGQPQVYLPSKSTHPQVADPR
jgi:hypothetical protein